MKVLSLFDGMGCGRIALDRARIPVTAYYASEIDNHAMSVAKDNYRDIQHVGDVTQLPGAPGIDLLIGGSPCQGFSFSGKQLNFDDPRSKLFFEFVRLLKECKPEYFLLENVKMKKESEAVITERLGVEPVYINSASFSAQDRKRLYWTNIPFNNEFTADSGLVLKDIIEPNVDSSYFLRDSVSQRYTGIKNYKPNSSKSCVIGKLSKYQGDRVFDVNCKGSSLSAFGGNNGGGGCNIIRDGNSLRRLTPVECERLQTVPDNYTKAATKAQRYKMLGNGWTVSVIAHILKTLTP